MGPKGPPQVLKQLRSPVGRGEASRRANQRVHQAAQWRGAAEGRVGSGACVHSARSRRRWEIDRSEKPHGQAWASGGRSGRWRLVYSAVNECWTASCMAVQEVRLVMVTYSWAGFLGGMALAKRG